MRYPVAALSLRDLESIVLYDQPLHKFQQVQDGVDARVGHPKPYLWAWVLVNHLLGGEVNSPACMSSG